MASIATNERSNFLHAIFSCGLVIFLADFGLVSEYDAVIGAFLISLAFPRLSPLLLLVISSIQDAPGLAGAAWYLGIVMVGIVALIHPKNVDVIDEKFYFLNKWGVAGTLVVLFAMAVSAVNQSLGGLPQAPQRNPLVVGGLMIFMIWVGLKSATLLQRNPPLAKQINSVIVFLITHNVGVAVLQVIIGPTFLVSTQGLSEIEDASSLLIDTAIGVPRITGTYLTPNGFALCMLLLVLVTRVSNKENNCGIGFTLLWFALGLLLTILSFSKAIGIFTTLVFIYLCSTLLWGRIMLAVFVSLAVISVTFSSPDFVQDLLVAFRVSSELAGESFRAQAWASVLDTLSWSDWLLGTGISHWPLLFVKHVGVSLADPHTWVLSWPGTFGVFGVLFFLSIILALLFIAIRKRGNEQMVAVSLLVLFLIKDLFSIQYLLGNTPISFLIWLILGLLITSDSRKLINSR